jgi:predicted nucleotidyltransferase
VAKIANCFSRLIERIQPTEHEIELAKRHVETIKKRLALTFKLKRVLVGGSYCRGTFIHRASDVDLFAVIARSEVTRGRQRESSKTVLNRFREQLAARYPNTSLGRDLHAIVVDFSEWPSVDVVPAVFDQMLEGRPQYLIPDGEGGWMTTSPERHSVYIEDADQRGRGKLTRVAQLMKFWRQCTSTRFALSSFHIEVLLAWTGVCSGPKSYAACMTEVLQSLASRECRALQDPLGISGLILAVKTDNQREAALASVKYARNHAKEAYAAECAGDTGRAWEQWNIVFNKEFPR